MFIQTESTPNPATLKFLPGVMVMDNNTANFTSADEAQLSPLARSLFDVAGVTGVFLGSGFISVTKSDGKDWDILKPLILGAIIDHFQSGRPMMEDTESPGEAGANGDDGGSGRCGGRGERRHGQRRVDRGTVGGGGGDRRSGRRTSLWEQAGLGRHVRCQGDHQRCAPCSAEG